MVSSQQICKAIIIIHVHVPLHCTAWINRESWSLVEHTQAGSFTFLTFNFVLWRAFSLLQCSQKKKSTPEDNSLQIAVNRSFWSTSRFCFFSRSLSFFFFSPVFLPLQVLLFWIVFWGLFSEVERDPEEAEFSALGWSPPSLSLSD